MIDERARHVGRLVLILDMLLAVFWYFGAMNFYGSMTSRFDIDFATHMILMPILIGSIGLSLTYFGAYRRLRVSMLNYSWMLCRAYIVSLAILFTLIFFFREHNVSRVVITSFTVISFLTLLLTRAILIWWYFKRVMMQRENLQKILIVGTGERAMRATELLKRASEWGVDILGYLDTDPARVGEEIDGVKVISTVDQISNVLKWHVVDEVVLAVPRSMMDEVESIVDACSEEGVRLKLMADLFDFKVARMQLEVVAGVPMLNFEPVAHHEGELFLKRLFDIIVTISAMPIILPLMALIAIAIRLDSNGPVLFVQQRVGYRKRLFPMYKFRSMYVGSEERLKEIEHLNEADGPIFKISNDPRVTRIGRLLRKTSLDELPQLFNVILGHMSLVGPRPMSTRDVNLFEQGLQRKRFSVRPGLTCLWQISGRSNLPFHKWLELDLAYIETWSFALDLKILFKTVPVVLRGEGAV